MVAQVDPRLVVAAVAVEQDLPAVVAAVAAEQAKPVVAAVVAVVALQAEDFEFLP